jgi:pimeloyl-ACP methyl ester carboxylesterase
MSTTSTVKTRDGFALSYRYSRGGDADKPLIVCLPGGTYTSEYFDVPGHSLLAGAAEAGFDVVAIDRPNYGGSDHLDDEHTTFAENARILSAGIDELWSQLGAGKPGVVLIAHSIGGSIAVHIAAASAQSREWPLIGVALSGANEKSPDHVVAAWQSVPAGVPVELGADQRRMFMYGPDGSFDPSVIDDAAPAGHPAPLNELLEIVGGWRSDYPLLAPRIEVPVHYTLAEFDALWIVSQERVDAFVAKLTRAPFVETELMVGVGHNIDHHHAGPAFQQAQLAFAQRCAAHARSEAADAPGLHDSV